jgi:hypothetical protein
MNDADARIRAALSAEDEAFLAGLDHERGLLAQVGDMFRGPIGRWTVLVYIMGVAVTALGAWTVVKMFAATDTRALILWTAAAMTCALMVTTVKLWAWSRMQTLSILRELKRIELRVARIEGK